MACRIHNYYTSTIVQSCLKEGFIVAEGKREGKTKGRPKTGEGKRRNSPGEQHCEGRVLLVEEMAEGSQKD